MNIRQGDIYWISLEEPQGSEPGYRQAHVVIQNNVFNCSKINTAVVCALTSNLQRAKAPGNFLLKKGQGNLLKDSVVNISQIMTVDKTDLTEKIGSLPQNEVIQIIKGLKLLLEPMEYDGN